MFGSFAEILKGIPGMMGSFKGLGPTGAAPGSQPFMGGGQPGMMPDINQIMAGRPGLQNPMATGQLPPQAQGQGMGLGQGQGQGFGLGQQLPGTMSSVLGGAVGMPGQGQQQGLGPMAQMLQMMQRRQQGQQQGRGAQMPPMMPTAGAGGGMGNMGMKMPPMAPMGTQRRLVDRM